MSAEKIQLVSALLLAISCSFMTAVSMVVGMLHYPTFREVSSNNWCLFHKSHCQKMGYIVIFPMLLQLASSITFSITNVNQTSTQWHWINVVCLIFSFGFTFAFSAPLHSKLSNSFNSENLNFLIKSNIIRTTFWFIHSLMAISFVLSQMLLIK